MSIKRETFVIDAFRVECDGCGAKGPFDILEKSNVIEYAADAGWTATEDGEQDFCPACSDKCGDGGEGLWPSRCRSGCR